MAISLNGVSGFGYGGYRSANVAPDVSAKRITDGAMVGAPPSVQQLGNNQEELETQPSLQLQGTFKVDHVSALEAPRRIAQLSEAQLPIHQMSYARSAYEAASAAQTMSDAMKIQG